MWSKLNENILSTENLYAILLIIYPVIAAIFLIIEYPRAEDLKFDDMTSTFIKFKEIERSMEIGVNNLIPFYSAIIILCFIPCAVILGTFCCFLFHDTFYQGLPKRRNRDAFQFVLSLFLLFSYGLQILYYFHAYTKLRYYSLPEEVIADRLFTSMESQFYEQDTIKRSWDKVQLNYDCCGAQNYTDWSRILTDKVPHSCCKVHASGCGNISVNVDAIYHAGCAKSFASHISDQVKLQSVYFIIFLLLIGVINLLVVLKGLESVLTVICRYTICKKGTKTETDKNSSKLLPSPLNTNDDDPKEPPVNDVMCDNGKNTHKNDNGSLMTVYYSDNETEDV